MTQEEIYRFLEDYRDGVVDPENARELAREIRRGGQAAEWAMEELAFSGWVSEALTSLDPESFVRSFLERLYAERSVDNFSSSLTTRIKRERQYRKSSKAKFRFPLLSQIIQGAGIDDDTANRDKPFPAAAAAFVTLSLLILAGISYGIWSYRSDMPSPRLASIESSSAGVTLSHGEEHTQAEQGTAIRQAYRVTVPPEGYARLNLDKIGSMLLTSDTIVVFGPPITSSGIAPTDNKHQLLLEKGEIIVQHRFPEPCLIITPHGQIRTAAQADFTITVTASSSHAKTNKGSVQFIHGKDGKSIIIPAGHYAIATDDAPFEPRELRQ